MRKPVAGLGVLAGTLNGATFGTSVVDMNADASSVTNTGQFIAAISMQAFGDVDQLRREVDALARSLRASQRMPGVEAIRLPGDGSHATRERYLRDGIPLHPVLIRDLAALADGLGVAPLGE